MIVKHVSALRWIGAILRAADLPARRAQSTIEPPIVSPGARSLGLGGAFVAVADDATAAWANPSGLMQLVRPEISLEGRSWSEDREGVASNQSSLGFLSFVLPRQKWSIAFYVQTLSSLEFPTQWTNNGGEVDPLSGLVVGNFGVSAALGLSDAVSIGFGLTAFAGSLHRRRASTPTQTNPFWDDDANPMREPRPASCGTSPMRGRWARHTGAAPTSLSNDGGRATIPDTLAAGARWKSTGGSATVAAEVEYLSGLENRTRLHLGGEWVFLKAKPLIGLRAGSGTTRRAPLSRQTRTASSSRPGA